MKTVKGCHDVKNIPPFKVQGMVTNGQVTDIKAAGREATILYETVDDKLAMVNVQVLNGDTDVVSKVLGPGISYSINSVWRSGRPPQLATDPVL